MEKQAIIQHVIDKTSNVFGLNIMDSIKSRKQNIREARQVVMYLVLVKFKQYKITQDEAGLIFGFSHVNSRHAKNRINDLIAIDKRFRAKIEQIEQNVNESIRLN